MKLSLRMGDRKIPIRPEAGKQSTIELDEECPNCKIRPILLRGGGKRIASYDTYEAPAVCCKCNTVVGTFAAKVSTLFGLEEDEAVMRMGAKVY